MNSLYIICIDDQQEVLNALERDLSAFEDLTMIEVCDSGKEALELIEELEGQGDHLAVVVSDQVMPGMSGVDVLREIQNDGRFSQTKKILLTGLATHQDTIEAINSGGLDYYIQKPWTKEHLTKTIKKALAEFVVSAGVEYQAYLEILDQEVLYAALRNKT